MTDQNLTITPDPPESQGGVTVGTGVPNVGNTGNGFIVGVQPPSALTPTVTSQQQNRTLTAEELELVRQQAAQAAQQGAQQGQALQTIEQRMAAMQAELDAARVEREASAKAAEDAEAARVAAEQAVAEEKLSATDLVNKVREEFQTRFDQMQETTATQAALLERERHFQAMEQYKASRLADPEIAAAVMPHLHRYIVGGTEAEIEESIALAAATSSNILSEFQAYQQQYRQQAPGVSTAAPSVGPMEQQASQQTMSAKQIAELSEAEYARLRPTLLRAAGEAFRASQGR